MRSNEAEWTGKCTIQKCYFIFLPMLDVCSSDVGSIFYVFIYQLLFDPIFVPVVVT